MPGFTSEEVQAAANRYLLSEISVPSLKTGSRDILALRDTVFDLLTTSLLLDVDSYFYLLWLAKNKLRKLVQQQIDSLELIEEWAPSAHRSSKLVDSTTDLTNAQSALLAVNAGLNARTRGVSGSIGPAVDRFGRSVDRFITTELTKNILDAGQIVETGEELRDSIGDQWDAVQARHGELVERTRLLGGSVGALGTVRLPSKSLYSIMLRIQSRLDELTVAMGGPSAAEASREAFLDLQTMKSLLRKASSFSAPTLVRAPLTGDPVAGVLEDSSGTEATVVGTVSGPYNYSASDTLELSVNGGASLPVITLPGTSAATLFSQEITTFPYPPAGTYEVALQSEAATNSGVLAPLQASGPALASAISSIVNPEITCEWDSALSKLVFRSGEVGDTSSLAVVVDTTNRLAASDVLFGGVPSPATASPVPVGDVVDAIHTQSSSMRASSNPLELAAFTGEVRPASLDTILDIRVEGADMVTTAGLASVSSPTVNFEALGVLPGWAIYLHSPVLQAANVVSVSGGTLVLDTTLGWSDPNNSYYLGPDHSSVPAGARVFVVGDQESGYRRVVSSFLYGITVDTPFGAAITNARTSVFVETLSISSSGTTTSSGIGVVTTNAALGLVSSAEVPATLSTIRITGADMLARGVMAGDLLELTSPSSVTYSVSVQSTTASKITFSPGVEYEAGSWGYQVTNAEYDTYNRLANGLSVFLASDHGTDLSAVDAAVNRIRAGARYTSAVSSTIETLLTDLRALREELDAYSVGREITIDRIVSMLREQGFDRAADILLKADPESFFSLGQDEVSYSSNLIRKAATAGREVTPVSRYARFEQVTQELRPTAYQPDPFDPAGQDELYFDE